MHTRHRWIVLLLLCFAGLGSGPDLRAEAASRRLETSDPMPALSVMDSQGEDLQYHPGDGSVLLVLFFAPEKPQSQRAAEDLEGLLRSLPSLPHPLVVAAVASDPNATDPIRVPPVEGLRFHFIRDADFKLWGRFGVIAAPTVFLSGTDGKIALIRAGYGYDFAPAIKTKLEVLMGLVSPEAVRDIHEVRTVTNTSAREKANRHLKLAQMLEERGRYESAKTQLETAVELAPDFLDSSLELGRVYCELFDPNSAITTVEGLSPKGSDGKGLRALVLGRAYGELAKYQAAEKYLRQAAEARPKDSRIFYELGKIFEVQGYSEKAMECYRQSLDLIYSDVRGTE